MNILVKLWLVSALVLTSACTTMRADYSVVTGPDPDPKTQMAAEELARHIGEMTGAGTDVEHVTSKGRIIRGRQGTFLIGNILDNPAIARLADDLPAGTLDVSGLDNDGILIHSAGKLEAPVVVLGGKTPTSNLYAVYDYLERYCDAGFFFDGDHIPRRDSLPMQNLALRHEPFFRDRHFGFSNTYGFKKYFNRFQTFDELDQMVDWMAKRKLNRTGWHIGCSPDGGGVVSENVFDFECKPEENYHAGWPGGTWDYSPEYRTKYLQHFFNGARERGVEVYYSIALGEVPAQYRKKHPDLEYVPHLGYEANILVPGSEDARRITGRMMAEINRLYGTDHIYQCTPFVESTGATSAEESFELKLAAAKQLCETLADLDPEYVWQSDSWDFGAVPAVWTPERIKQYFERLSDYHDRMYMYDVTSDTGGWWERSNYFGGINWAFGMLQAFQGDDHLHGDLARLLRNVRKAVSDPKATGLKGYYHVPESFGHNTLLFHFSTQLTWEPTSLGIDEFLRRYCVTRYGRENAEPMLTATRKLVDAVYSGAGVDMYYQRMGIRYNPVASPPFDDFQAQLGYEKETHREAALMEEVVAMMLEQRDVLADNPLYINDLVDYTRTMLGIKSNAYVIDAYQAFKRGQQQEFEKAAERVMQCLQGIELILSTRPDFSLEKMVDEVMSVPGTNPYLPKMIRHHLINDIYATVEVYEQLALYYKPKMEAYLNAMREQMARGENTLTRGMLDDSFNKLDEQWRQNDVDCPDEWAFDGTTLEAIEANWRIVPLGEVTAPTTENVNLKENQILEVTPGTEYLAFVKPVSWADGPIQMHQVEGVDCWRIGDASNYLYFRVDPELAYKTTEPIALTVRYYDGDPAQLLLHYDSQDQAADMEGAYKAMELVRTAGSGEWKTVRVVLEDAQLAKRQNGNTDFRLCAVGGPMSIAGVAVSSTRTTELPVFGVVDVEE